MMYRILSILTGCGMVVGSVCAWRFWDLPGLIAVIAGLFGSWLIEFGITGRNSFDTSQRGQP